MVQCMIYFKELPQINKRVLRIQGFLHYEMLVDNHLQVTTYGTDKDRFALHAVLHTISINCIENTLCDYIYK